MTIKAPREDGGMIRIVEWLWTASGNPVITWSVWSCELWAAPQVYIIRLKLAPSGAVRGSQHPSDALCLYFCTSIKHQLRKFWAHWIIEVHTTFVYNWFPVFWGSFLLIVSLSLRSFTAVGPFHDGV